MSPCIYIVLWQLKWPSQAGGLEGRRRRGVGNLAYFEHKMDNMDGITWIIPYFH